jgi:hypothetical protein
MEKDRPELSYRPNPELYVRHLRLLLYFSDPAVQQHLRRRPRRMARGEPRSTHPSSSLHNSRVRGDLGGDDSSHLRADPGKSIAS